MRCLSGTHRITFFLNVLMLGVGLIWTGGAFAEAPMGIIGDVTVQNDDTNPVPVEITNGESDPVAVKLSESANSHVVLHFRFDSNDVCGPQLPGQGIFHAEVPGASPLVDPEPFVVPAGKTLLITHVNWTAFGGQVDQWVVGEYLRMVMGRNTGEFRLTAGTPITSELAASHNFTGNVNINNGVPFRAGENVCIIATFRVNTGGGNSDNPSLNGTIAHGHLVDQ